MKYAKFSDDFLSYFRLDDSGKTLVLTDKRGYTRAVKLLPYEERPQGEWIKHSTYKDVLICSNCNHGSNQVYDTFNFCPNCGAEMRKGDES